jgi:hypothetical protein
MRTITCSWASKSATKQRTGRAGRVANGTVYRMYSKSAWALFQDNDPTELLPLENTALQVYTNLQKYGKPVDVLGKLVTPPSVDDINAAIRRLIEWGMIDESGTTSIGLIALGLPIDITLTRMIMTGIQLGCAVPAMIIAAGLSIQKPLMPRPIAMFYKTPEEYRDNVYMYEKSVKKFDRDQYNDMFMFVHIYIEMSAIPKQNLFRWCNDNYLSPKQIVAFDKSVNSIIGIFKCLKLPGLDLSDVVDACRRYNGHILMLLLSRYSSSFVTGRISDGRQICMRNADKLDPSNTIGEVERTAKGIVEDVHIDSSGTLTFNLKAVSKRTLYRILTQDSYETLMEFKEGPKTFKRELEFNGVRRSMYAYTPMCNVRDGRLCTEVEEDKVVIDRWSNAYGTIEIYDEYYFGISFGACALNSLSIASTVATVTGDTQVFLCACMALLPTFINNKSTFYWGIVPSRRIIVALKFGEVLVRNFSVSIDAISVVNILLRACRDQKLTQNDIIMLTKNMSVSSSNDEIVWVQSIYRDSAFILPQ